MVPNGRLTFNTWPVVTVHVDFVFPQPNVFIINFVIMCVPAESGSAVCEFFMRAACQKGKNTTRQQSSTTVFHSHKGWGLTRDGKVKTKAAEAELSWLLVSSTSRALKTLGPTFP